MRTVPAIACILILDQATKYAVSHLLTPDDAIPVIGGIFNISHVRNTGAAFGSMSDAGPMLIVVSIVVLGLMLAFRRTLTSGSRLKSAAYVLMVSGVIGNLLDRLRLAYVVDFLDFFIGTHHFPSFNVADSSICIGVTLFLLSSLSHSDCAKPAAQATTTKSEAPM